MRETTAIFVYGTLKRGACRERFWPHRPRSVQRAFIRAMLFDLGPYPAVVPGLDWVAGELWWLQPSQWEETLAALDAVEGYGISGEPDLYARRTVPWHLHAGGPGMGQAQVYFWADARLPAGARRVVPRPVEPDQPPVASWPVRPIGAGVTPITEVNDDSSHR